MQIEQQIQNAIVAHAEWKQRLNATIETGRSAHSVATVCLDDQCALGRWLLSLDAATKATNRWQCVRSTHAEFHREAGRILEEALAGNKRGARALMSYSSSFAGLSNKLSAELAAWKRDSVGQFSPLPASAAIGASA